LQQNVNRSWFVVLNKWDFLSNGQPVVQNLNISFCAAKTPRTTAISFSCLRIFSPDDGSHLSRFRTVFANCHISSRFPLLAAVKDVYITSEVCCLNNSGYILPESVTFHSCIILTLVSSSASSHSSVCSFEEFPRSDLYFNKASYLRMTVKTMPVSLET
jgi:hypothetical protein